MKYEQTKTLDPNHFGAYVNSGVAYCKLGELLISNQDMTVGRADIKLSPTVDKYFHKALKELDKAIEIRPKSFIAHYCKGRTLNCGQQFKEAVDVLESSLKLVKADRWFEGSIPAFEEELNEEIIVDWHLNCMIGASLKCIMHNMLGASKGDMRILVQGPSAAYRWTEDDSKAFVSYQMAIAEMGIANMEGELGQYLPKSLKYASAYNNLMDALILNPSILSFWGLKYEIEDAMGYTDEAVKTKNETKKLQMMMSLLIQKFREDGTVVGEN